MRLIVVVAPKFGTTRIIGCFWNECVSFWYLSKWTRVRRQLFKGLNTLRKRNLSRKPYLLSRLGDLDSWKGFWARGRKGRKNARLIVCCFHLFIFIKQTKIWITLKLSEKAKILTKLNIISDYSRPSHKFKKKTFKNFFLINIK